VAALKIIIPKRSAYLIIYLIEEVNEKSEPTSSILSGTGTTGM
jgi:hypothetical protein